MIADPFTLDMDFILAIHIIQKNERGRQGRDRFQKFLEKIKNQVK